nr:MAG TPA: hypothetical protein [Herelleviridae sp.]
MKYPYLVELYAKHVVRDNSYINNVPEVIKDDVEKRVKEMEEQVDLV